MNRRGQDLEERLNEVIEKVAENIKRHKRLSILSRAQPDRRKLSIEPEPEEEEEEED